MIKKKLEINFRKADNHFKTKPGRINPLETLLLPLVIEGPNISVLGSEKPNT